MKRDQEQYAWVQQMKDSFKDVKELSVKETLEFREKWRRRFTDDSMKTDGIILHNCQYCGGRRNSFDWHAFSFRNVPADMDYVLKIRALSHLEERVAIWVERCGLPGIVVKLGEFVDYLERTPSITEELYAMPIKQTWTLVFTHEGDMGCGPYFVVAEK